MSQGVANTRIYELIEPTYKDKPFPPPLFLSKFWGALYRIIKSIDASLNKGIITEDEAKEYIGIVRSQLSAYELVIICYNGQTTVGEKFKELIIKYNLLKNIRENLVKYSYYLDEKLKNVE